jgi:hypothetical protein
MLVLGAIAHQEQEAGGRQGLDQATQQSLGLRIQPVQVLEHQQQRLRLALAHEHARESGERALAALGWIELQEWAIVGQYVKEREERWQRVLEGLIQG